MVVNFELSLSSQSHLNVYNKTLHAVINHVTSSLNAKLKCMCAHYKCYVVINYNSVYVNNCALLQL